MIHVRFMVAISLYSCIIQEFTYIASRLSCKKASFLKHQLFRIWEELVDFPIDTCVFVSPYIAESMILLVPAETLCPAYSTCQRQSQLSIYYKHVTVAKLEVDRVFCKRTYCLGQSNEYFVNPDNSPLVLKIPETNFNMWCHNDVHLETAPLMIKGTHIVQYLSELWHPNEIYCTIIVVLVPNRAWN